MKILIGVGMLLFLLAAVGYGLLRPYPPIWAPPVSEMEVAPPAPLASPVPVVAPTGPLPLSTEGFRQLAADVMKELPNRTSVVANARNGRPAVLDAGQELERIVKAAGAEPGLEAEAVTLFRECVLSPQYLDVVRALCLYHFRFLSRKSGQNMRDGFAPPMLRSLADKLAG